MLGPKIKRVAIAGVTPTTTVCIKHHPLHRPIFSWMTAKYVAFKKVFHMPNTCPLFIPFIEFDLIVWILFWFEKKKKTTTVNLQEHVYSREHLAQVKTLLENGGINCLTAEPMSGSFDKSPSITPTPSQQHQQQQHQQVQIQNAR